VSGIGLALVLEARAAGARLYSDVRALPYSTHMPAEQLGEPPASGTPQTMLHMPQLLESLFVLTQAMPPLEGHGVGSLGGH